MKLFRNKVFLTALCLLILGIGIVYIVEPDVSCKNVGNSQIYASSLGPMFKHLAGSNNEQFRNCNVSYISNWDGYNPEILSITNVTSADISDKIHWHTVSPASCNGYKDAVKLVRLGFNINPHNVENVFTTTGLVTDCEPNQSIQDPEFLVVNDNGSSVAYYIFVNTGTAMVF